MPRAASHPLFAGPNSTSRPDARRGNGTSTSYGFDAASPLTALTQDLSGTAHDIKLGFAYNPASQIVSNTRSNDAFAWTSHYNVNRAYAANGRNQYSQSGAVVPTYDAKGNLTGAGDPTYADSRKPVGLPGRGEERRRYSVVWPSKWSLAWSASACSLVLWTTPSLCSGGA